MLPRPWGGHPSKPLEVDKQTKAWHFLGFLQVSHSISTYCKKGPRAILPQAHWQTRRAQLRLVVTRTRGSNPTITRSVPETAKKPFRMAWKSLPLETAFESHGKFFLKSHLKMWFCQFVTLKIQPTRYQLMMIMIPVDISWHWVDSPWAVQSR